MSKLYSTKKKKKKRFEIVDISNTHSNVKCKFTIRDNLINDYNLSTGLDKRKIYFTKKDAIQNLLMIAVEELDMRIINYRCSENTKECYSEIEFWSKAGEDFIFTILHDNTIEDFVKKFQEYADDFDAEEHAEFWIKNKNMVTGVPQSIRVLIDDAEDIKKTLEDGVIKLEKMLLDDEQSYYLYDV